MNEWNVLKGIYYSCTDVRWLKFYSGARLPVVSLLRHAEFEPNGHQEYAPHFMNHRTLMNLF